MDITEVRIKLTEDSSERLQAFCSITFDHCFVIRDLKIIEGTNGPFVAMPSRKLTAHCPQCGCKNHLRAGYCNQCGMRLPPDRVVKDEDGRAKLYADIAHPINSVCREMIQEKVVAEYYLELERAKQPGYVSRYDDYDYEDFHPARNTHARHNPPHYAKSAAPDKPAQHAPRAPHVKHQPPPSANHHNHPPAGQAGDFGAGIF
ncbi:MAG: SpoVG family protein [Pirellulales bacterium]|nr:SpoVG family protein [Pirellulales bacterium]